MKYIYLPNFENYHSQHYCYLISDRVSRFVVRVGRQFGDLPFWKYYQMRLYFQIARWFRLRADAIEYEIKVTHGMEKDVIWRKRGDVFVPYDSMADVEMPHLARKQPPTKKRIRKGFVVEAKG